MRLIDADALIFYMEENPPSYGDMDRVIAAVNDAPTVGGWISVKDGLPNDSKPVYVWLGIGSSLRSGIPFVGKYNIFSGEWMIYGLRADNQEIIKITHWMSLPEPPEEESNGN